MLTYYPLIPFVREVLIAHPDWTNTQIAQYLQDTKKTVVSNNPVMVRYRTMISTYGAKFANDIIDALEIAVATNKTIKRILPTIMGDGNDSGVDVSHPITRQIIDSMVGSVLTQDQANKLKAMGETPVSLAEQVGFTSGVGLGYIKAARDNL